VGEALSASNNLLQARVRPPEGEPAGALVLFHGRGADELDLQPLLDAIDPDRRLVGILPRGPLVLPPGGAHWYVVPRVGYPDPNTFWPTYEVASKWLDGLGVPSDRIVLGGFSQGAVMSYALGLGRGRPQPAGIIALSGFIPTVDGFELDLAPPLPRFAIGHGTHDEVISVEFAREAKKRLENSGADVVYRESPTGHSIDPRFVLELRAWVTDVVGAAVH
jgi:phospholipase/carboxylesterase